MKKMLILAAFGLFATAAAAQEEPAADLKALAESCDAHKFETTVIVEGSRGKKVKICGKPGQSDADWLVTLRDSAAKVEADEAMAPDVKDQIAAALEAEIQRLETAATPVVAPVATIDLPQRPVIVPEATPQYSSVPPLPAPLPRAKPASARPVSGAAGLSAAAAAVVEPVVRPDLSIRCALPRESFAACARLERETQLLIRAGGDIAPGTSLRFLRGGDTRAELDLGTLKKGETMREKLPGRVCAGVLRGKVQFQLLNKGRVAETLGPYALYCGS